LTVDGRNNPGHSLLQSTLFCPSTAPSTVSSQPSQVNGEKTLEHSVLRSTSFCLSTVNRQRSTVFMLAVAMQACAPLNINKSRAAKSSLGCMHAAIAKHPLADLPDYQAHCVAAGLIALHCGASEAWLASVGKELRDLVTPRENAEWRDLQSDRRGIHCAQSATTDSSRLIACCSDL
jgi:hypothetical protein